MGKPASELSVAQELGIRLRARVRGDTAILAVYFTSQAARREKSNCRARPHGPRRKASLTGLVGMALRRMGKMPMPQENGFSHTL